MSDIHVNTINATAVGIGKKSTATVIHGGSREAERRLGELVALVHANRDAVAEPDRVLADASELHDAFERDTRDGRRLGELVERLRLGVGSTAQLVNAADALARSIGSLS